MIYHIYWYNNANITTSHDIQDFSGNRLHFIRDKSIEDKFGSCIRTYPVGIFNISAMTVNRIHPALLNVFKKIWSYEKGKKVVFGWSYFFCQLLSLVLNQLSLQFLSFPFATTSHLWQSCNCSMDYTAEKRVRSQGKWAKFPSHLKTACPFAGIDSVLF